MEKDLEIFENNNFNSENNVVVEDHFNNNNDRMSVEEERVNENKEINMHSVYEEEEATDVNIENMDNEVNADNQEEKNKNEGYNKKTPFCRMPIAKIKNIIKLNPDVKMCLKEVYPYLGKAVEMLFEDLAIKAAQVAKFNKRRTMNPEDVCK